MRWKKGAMELAIEVTLSDCEALKLNADDVVEQQVLSRPGLFRSRDTL